MHGMLSRRWYDLAVMCSSHIQKVLSQSPAAVDAVRAVLFRPSLISTMSQMVRALRHIVYMHLCIENTRLLLGVAEWFVTHGITAARFEPSVAYELRNRLREPSTILMLEINHLHNRDLVDALLDEDELAEARRCMWPPLPDRPLATVAVSQPVCPCQWEAHTSASQIAAKMLAICALTDEQLKSEARILRLVAPSKASLKLDVKFEQPRLGTNVTVGGACLRSRVPDDECRCQCGGLDLFEGILGEMDP
jgi:hypothetical protein